MMREIATTRLIEVACPQEEALAVIWEIQNIEKTEVKADAAWVSPESKNTGTYKVRGHFTGIPWHSEFAYTLHSQGFHSLEAHPPLSGTRIQGGFVVVPTGEQSCTILHYEQYKLPRWAIPLKPIVEGYLQWSMKKEMHDLKEIILRCAANVAG